MLHAVRTLAVAGDALAIVLPLALAGGLLAASYAHVTQVARAIDAANRTSPAIALTGVPRLEHERTFFPSKSPREIHLRARPEAERVPVRHRAAASALRSAHPMAIVVALARHRDEPRVVVSARPPVFAKLRTKRLPAETHNNRKRSVPAHRYAIVHVHLSGPAPRLPARYRSEPFLEATPDAIVPQPLAVAGYARDE